MKQIAVIGIALVMIVGDAAGQKARTLPSSREIMRNMSRNFRGVNDLTATMTGEIRMERIQVPKTIATMYFKRPDLVHFESKGFSMMPREGTMLNPDALAEKYDIAVVGTDTVAGSLTYKLELTGKDLRVRGKTMFAWVDPAHWTIARLELMPYGGRVISVDFTYASVGDTLWLPARMQAMFGGSTPEADAAFKVPDNMPVDPAAQMSEMSRAMRSGSITFLYSNYRINTGLPDSLFVQPADRR